MTTTEEIYVKLGTLLTAIIDLNKIIPINQRERLKRLVQLHLKVEEELTDSKGRMRVYNMRLIFPQQETYNTDSVFDAYREFIEKNQHAFNDTMKKISLDVMQELSLIYLGTSKTEKGLLDQLKRKLKKIKINSHA